MMRIIRKNQSDEKITELKKIKPGSWIDLVNPTKSEIDLVIEKTGVSKNHIMTTLDEDERPRIDVDGNILVIIRAPYQLENNPTLKIKTVPIGIIITEDNIITVRLFEMKALNDFHGDKVKGFYTEKKTRFLVQILSRTNYYFLKNLDKIEAETNSIEAKLMTSLKNEEVIRLFELQKMLIYFNTSIIGNGNILESILKGKVLKLYKEDQDILDDIITENRQCLEMTTTYSSILSNTLDAYASVVSNNLNVVMKLLASLTIILSIPALISSFYGMNVGMPFQSDPMAFVYMILISVFLSIIVGMVFVKKKWL